MGDNTQNSGSSRRSFKGRIPINTSEATNSLKNSLNHLGESLSRGMGSIKGKGSILHEKRMGRESAVYSKGVRQLDNYGYERFNIGEESEIFISKLSSTVDFNEGEPVLVRATEGNYVGQADPHKSSFSVPEEKVGVDDARSLFQNVPRGTVNETTYKAEVGVNEDGHVVPQVDNSFLQKMNGKAKVTHAAPRIDIIEDDDEHVIIAETPAEPAEEAVNPADFASLMNKIKSGSRPAAAEAEVSEEAPVEMPAEAPVAEPVVAEEPAVVEEPVAIEEPVVEMPAEAPAEVQAEEVPVVEQVVEAVADEPVAGEDVLRGMPAEGRTEEFFVDTEEAAEPESLPCDDNVEYEDYDWMFEDDGLIEAPEVGETPVEQPVIEAVADETPVEEVQIEEPAEAQAEEPVVEIPAVEPVVEAPAEMQAEEVPAVEPAAEVPEVSIESVVEELSAQAVAEQAAVEATVDSVVVEESRKASENAIEGLLMDGHEPSSDVVSSHIAATGAVHQTAVTGSAGAQPRHSTAIGLAADGEALPPMSDPVITRPRPNRAMRFKFNNGVLVNVAKEESKEGLQSPLE